MTTRNRSRVAAAFLMAAACGLATASGGASAGQARAADGAAHGAKTKATTPSDTFARGFVITDPVVLGKVAADFKVGPLLEAVRRYLNEERKKYPEQNWHDPKDFAISPFSIASGDVDNHNALKDSDPVYAKIGVTKKIVNTFSTAILPPGVYDPDTGKEPFRLIAVVNRLDLAGDFDTRGGGVLAGAERKWFGEGRLIYTLDGPTGPLPMTISLEYRLPALMTGADGKPVVNPDYDYTEGPADANAWREGRKLWALEWQSLAAMDPTTTAYYKKLRNLMSRFAYGIEYDATQFGSTLLARNHLAMRTGEQVRDQKTNLLTTEFEYREFYLNGTWMLSTRKLRREPAFCANPSPLLVNRLNDEWWNTQMSWRYTLGARTLDYKLGEVDQLRASCGNKLPYGAKDDDSNDVELRAKFARFTPTPPTTIWRPAFTDATDVIEQKSHSFAAGTCSGCHGNETGTGGFHIAPAASGASAPLSKFLKSATSASPRGVMQYYDEPTRRMDLLTRFANDEDVSYAVDPLLYDPGCKHIDQVDTECLNAPPVAPGASRRIWGAH